MIKAFGNTGAPMLELFFPDPFLQTQQSALLPRGGLSPGPHPQRITAAVFPSAVTSARGLFFQMLRTNSGIQNKFAQEVLIFFRGDGHLISVGSCVPNLTQQCPSVGCVVYVWKAKTLCSAKRQGNQCLSRHWCRAEPRTVRSPVL